MEATTIPTETAAGEMFDGPSKTVDMPPPPLTLSKSYRPSIKKGDEDYHIGLSHIPLIGENRRPNPFFKESVRREDDHIREKLKELFEKSHVKTCGETVSMLVVLFENDARQLSHSGQWRLSFEEVRKSPLAGNGSFWEGLCCPGFALKRMRLLALGVPENEIGRTSGFTGIIRCSKTVSSERLKNYECCQGYQDGYCIKPSVCFRGYSGSEVGLNCEVCLFPGSSADSTMQYMYDTRDLPIDPTFKQYNLMIKRAEMFKTIFDQSTKYTPIGPCTGPVVQAMGIVINFFKRLTIPFLLMQVEEQTKPGNSGFKDEGELFYRPELQGRHKNDNSLVKMVNRYNTGKPYIVKRTIKGYFEPQVRHVVSGNIAIAFEQQQPNMLPLQIGMSV